MDEWNLNSDESRIPIWLDCDTGHDDAFALLLAAMCPRFHLLGVSTVHGNASLQNTTKNTLSILKAIGREDVRVFPGAIKPFCREAVHAESIHGESGLDGTTLLPEAPDLPFTTQHHAIRAMYDALSSTSKGTAWLVTTGAMTNAGLLFALHPELADHIAGLSVMGGAIGGFFSHAALGRIMQRLEIAGDLHKVLPNGLSDTSDASVRAFARQLIEAHLIKNKEVVSEEQIVAAVLGAGESFGNWTDYAEFNIYIDPESSKAVFGNPMLAQKTKMITLDITHQVLANEEMLELLGLRSRGAYEPSTLRKLFLEILTFFTQTYEREFGMNGGPPLHDPVAVAMALSQSMFDDNDGERYAVHVVTDGDDSVLDHTRNAHNVGRCGQTVATRLPPGTAGVRIPRTLDIPKFWNLVRLGLDKAENRSPL